jgi:DNA-binding CsgD family transcriptional regulator
MLRRLVHPFTEADSAAEAIEALEAVCRPLGVSVWGVGRSTPDASWPREREEIAELVSSRLLFHPGVSNNFRMDWKSEFARHGPSELAPYAASNPGPFTFVEAFRLLQPTAKGRWFFDVCRDHGARDALFCSYGPWLVVYSSDHALGPMALPHQTRFALNAVGGMAVTRIKELTLSAKADTPPELSARQRTVLLHLGDGLTVPEIAARLGIAETSVKMFVRRAVRKLGAKSQLHAVALALRQRLI